jgi:hypothetical protein
LTQKAIIDFLTYAELAATATVLLVMTYRKQLAEYTMLASFLGVRLVSTLGCMILLDVSTGGSHAHRLLMYRAYFYSYWASYAIEALLGIGIVYSIYRVAMTPLKGLQSLGMLMFRWAAGIAIAVAVFSAFGPNLTATRFVVAAVTKLQETQSILTLCLLLFVTLAIRPMGLSYRSRVFGISLGLGLMATMGLVQAAWIAHTPSMFSAYSVFNGFAILGTLTTWTAYFAMPEPRRRIIVLPTTSPFLRWNQISAALGDDPGYVAVGGVHPEIFAPAELEVMKRASVKMMMEPISVGK